MTGRITTLATVLVVGHIVGLLPGSATAQNRSEDEYTRYELLAPETASFKIVYDVTAVTPGAKFYLQSDSHRQHRDRRVRDRSDDRRAAEVPGSQRRRRPATRA